VIDDEGRQLGVLSRREALALALENGLDLVEVAPTSQPPVCRLLDYGKFRYLQSTRDRELRKTTKVHAMREVRMRPRIGKHDFDAKGRLVQRLLIEGSKVKVSVMFRGREPEHPEIAVNLLRQLAEVVKEESKLEQTPNLEGRFMSIVLAPTKVAVKAPTPQAQSSEKAKEDAEAQDP